MIFVPHHEHIRKAKEGSKRLRDLAALSSCDLSINELAVRSLFGARFRASGCGFGDGSARWRTSTHDGITPLYRKFPPNGHGLTQERQSVAAGAKSSSPHCSLTGVDRSQREQSRSSINPTAQDERKR